MSSLSTPAPTPRVHVLRKPHGFPSRGAYWLAGAALMAAVLVLLNGCTGQRDRDAGKPVLYRDHGDAVRTWDPANSYDTISGSVLYSVLEQLYQYKYLNETYTVEPLLAADLPKLSKDKLTVTIPVRRGVKFADDGAFKATQGKGRELTAHDFVFAWKRLALPALQSQGMWIFDGKVKGFREFHQKLLQAGKEASFKLLESESVEGIRATDDFTLEIALTKPYPQLLYILAMSFTSPVAVEAARAYADENGNLTDKPVGTGPFTLKSWDRQREIVLERNPTYHDDFFPTRADEKYEREGVLADAGKKLPFVDKIVVKVIKERQPAWLGFLKGEQDFTGIPKDNFDSAIVNKVNLAPEIAGKGVRLTIEPTVTFWFMDFNFKDKLFGKNKALRQAFSSTIDREKWIELFTNGRGQKMTHALPPTIPDRAQGTRIKYDYDLARARDLLKKAGYPGGKGLPEIRLEMRGSDSVARQLGEFFTSEFAKIGVKLTPNFNTFPAFLEKIKQGNFQVSYGGWAMDYPDAENVYQLLYGPNQAPGPNDGSYDHPALNKLYEQMAVMESGPARARIVARMEDHIQEEIPWAYGYYSTAYDLTQPWLKNYRSSDFIQNGMKYLRVDLETKARYRK